MQANVRDIKRKALTDASAQLAKQYEAAVMQSATTADAAVRVQAEQSAASISERMTKIQHQLEQLELVLPAFGDALDPGRDRSRIQRQLSEHLHKIDFEQVERWLRDLMRDHAKRGRAGLVMFDNAGTMNGRLCAERVRKILGAKTSAGKFRHMPIRFRPADRNDSGALLRHLAIHLGLDLADRLQGEQMAFISETLCGSLQAGGILLLEIGHCDYLTRDHPAAFQWIVTEFWQRLLRDLETASCGFPASVTVIVLLFFDAKVPDEAVALEHRCDTGCFKRERLLEFALVPWTRQQIIDWLCSYGLPDNYPEDDTRVLADTIHDATGGTPSLIENELLERCAAL